MDNTNKSLVIENNADGSTDPKSGHTRQQSNGLGKEYHISCTNRVFIPEKLNDPQDNSGQRNKSVELSIGNKLSNELVNGNSTNLEESDAPRNEDKVEADTVGVKDTGYAWVAVAAMFVANVLTIGYVKGFGVIYNEIMVQYPEANGTMAGVMMSLLSGCKSLCAPLVGPMASYFGVRKTLFMGVSLYVSGLFISYFCTSLIQLSVTLGAMIGLGHCILETAQIIIIAQYFEKKLSKANGIRVAGNPCGGILFPHLLTLLLQKLGLKITYLVLSAIALNVFICAFLMKPFNVNERKKFLGKVKSLFGTKINNAEGERIFLSTKKFFNRKVSHNTYHVDITNQTEVKGLSYITNYQNSPSLYSSDRRDIQNQTEEAYEKFNQEINKVHSREEKRELEKKSKRRLDFSFFKNPQYILYIVMATSIPVGVPLALYYTALYAKNEANLTHYEVSILLSYQAVFDCFLRIFIGWINNKNLYKKSNGLVVCLWLSALGCISMTFGNNSLLYLIGSISLYSFGPAANQTFVNVILTERFGKENIATTWGFVRMTHGIFCFVHPPIIGYFIDSTGSYVIPFYIMGGGLILSGLIVIAERCFGEIPDTAKKIVDEK